MLRHYSQSHTIEFELHQGCKILRTIGDIYRLQQENDMALEHYRQALALFGELKELAEETSVRRAIDEIEHPQATFQPLVLHTLPKDTLEPIALSPLPQPEQPSRWSRRGSFRGIILLPITLALLLIVSSGLLYYINVAHPAELRVQATALVKSQNAKTAVAEHNATATIFAQATATAVANPNPYLPYTGTLALNDPLQDNSSGNKWDVYSGIDGGCAFTGSTYHASEPKVGYFFTCISKNSTFSNFVLEVQMKIIKGDCGGIIFRGNLIDFHLYLLRICQNGHYELDLYKNASGSDAKTLTSGFDSSILFGSPFNRIAIMANMNSYHIYINNSEFETDSAMDSSYISGQIGFTADAYSKSTEVAYRNVRVWRL